MNQSSSSADVVFRDALGERRRVIDATGHETELLCFSTELSSVPAFEPALTRSVNRLTDFRHPFFPVVRGSERTDGAALAVVSDAVHGVRLARLLTNLVERGIALEVGAALCITRQIISAIEALHAYDRDVAHGALGPERIIINANARVIVADYALGPALEQLRYSHQHYWKSLRIGLPRSAGVTKFDHRVDIMQIGSIAVALILGRLLRDDEYSGKLVDLVGALEAPGSDGELMPIKRELRTWLLRSIQADPFDSFSTVTEAGAVLDSLQTEEERANGMSSLERVLMRHHGIAPAPTAVKPVASPPPVDPPAPVVAKPPVAATPPPPVVAPPPGVATPAVVATPIGPPAPVVAKPFAPPKVAEPAAPVATFATHVEPPVHASAVVPPAPIVNPPAPPPMPIAAAPQAHSTPAPLAPTATMPLPHLPRPSVRETRANWQHVAVAVFALAALTAGGMFMLRRRALASGLNVPTGTLTVQSNPSGVPLDVDGKSAGFTPATLTVQQGTHTIVLRGSGEPKTMSVAVAAGAQVSQYIEFAKSAPTTGGLHVRTEPPGAMVTIDHVPHGASPATINNLSPGDHTVVVTADGVSVDQTVTVEAGVTSSLVVPLTRERSLLSGWVAVSAPIDVQIFENGQLLGTNQTDRVMVSSGEHHLDFVNDTLGYRFARTLSVRPGKVETVSLKLPSGSIALNAVPWAEVWIDGEKAGDTPIGNLQKTIGKHEVVFRHPDFGETRQTVTVTLLGPARLSVDMRKK